MDLCSYSVIGILKCWWITRLLNIWSKVRQKHLPQDSKPCYEMHTNNTLSRLHNLTDTLDNKDVIPLNFLQHLTPNYIEHSYSHWVDNLYVQKDKRLWHNTGKEKVR